MPEMDGFEVYRRIKGDPLTAHIPVVMVPALSDTRDWVKGLEAGADDFLTKPVQDVALFARINSLVRLKRASDEWRVRAETSIQLRISDAEGSLIADDAPGKVLLVEDHEANVERIAGTLRGLGHEVIAVENCSKGLSQAISNDFHVVLMSDRVGGEDSLRLCTQLRAHKKTRHGTILLMIDEGETERLAMALELGVNDYLVKPIARSRTHIKRKRYEDQLRANYRQSLSAALTDSLTGLRNRRYLEVHFEALAKELAEAEKPMKLMILDIDHFKSINVTHRHNAGDEVLKELAQRILDSVRGFDTVVRLGGEEFVIIMPETPVSGATHVAERLRRKIAETPITASDEVGALDVTVSVGLAGAVIGSETLEMLIKTADEALYQATRNGHNQIIVLRDPELTDRPSDGGQMMAG